MDNFLQSLLAKIVSQPERLKITSSEDDNTITVHILLDQRDCGRVIGKKGKTINSIRNLLHVFLAKTQKLEAEKRIVLKIEEQPS